jgi:hypothetical protein
MHCKQANIHSVIETYISLALPFSYHLKCSKEWAKSLQSGLGSQYEIPVCIFDLRGLIDLRLTCLDRNTLGEEHP